MHVLDLLCALLVPLCSISAAARAPRANLSPRAFASRAVVATLLAVAFAIVAAGGLIANGAHRSPLLGAGGVGLSVHLDALAAIMLILVSFVAAAVVRFSRNYLEGDPGHIRFTRWLLVTASAVEALLISGNLFALALAWIATSLSLHKLLVFYGERPAAQRAARKKFVVSRVGDLCLIVAAALLYRQFGTLEIPDLIGQAKTLGATQASASTTLAALLIIITAVLKSAQAPLHGWLLEVMETPTPVSALLHAGIINAGGFLVLRLADVMLLAPSALEALAAVGGLTALFGSLAMLTQTSIKVQLAYSTIAQMGFMLLQCGLGAFSSALLHIVAHSLYKAHAFLSSGSVVDMARLSWSAPSEDRPDPVRLVVALVTVVVVALGVAAGFGGAVGANPAQFAFVCVLLMGLLHLVSSAWDRRSPLAVVVRVGVWAGGVAIVYFALQWAAALLVSASVPVGRRVDGTIELVLAALVVLGFGALTWFQNQIMRHATAPFWIAVYVHLRSGLYLNTFANRLVLALWPRRALHASNPS